MFPASQPIGFHQHGAQGCHSGSATVKFSVANEVKDRYRIFVAFAATEEFAVVEYKIVQNHNMRTDHDPHQEKVFGGGMAEEGVHLLHF